MLVNQLSLSPLWGKFRLFLLAWGYVFSLYDSFLVALTCFLGHHIKARRWPSQTAPMPTDPLLLLIHHYVLRERAEVVKH